MKRVSTIRSKQLAKYAKLKREFLEKNEHCFACQRLVPIEERVLHHFYKRRGLLLAWVPGFRLTHDECHFCIHLDETAARKANLLAPKECCDDFARAVKHHQASLQTELQEELNELPF